MRGVGTATIRLEDDLLKQVRQYGINLSEAARTGIQEAIRRERMLHAIDRLAKKAVKPKEPSLKTIRRLRDGG